MVETDAEYDFTGKVIVVSPASFGIGKQVAQDFAKAGGTIVLIGHHLEKLEENKNIIQKFSKKEPMIIKTDMYELDQRGAEILCDDIINRFGRIDVIVNVNGVLEYEIENLNLQLYDKFVVKYVRAFCLFLQKAKKYLTVTKGSIVNVSTITEKVPHLIFYKLPNQAATVLTVHRLDMYEKNGVRCNSIIPDIKIDRIDSLVRKEDACAKFLKEFPNTESLGTADLILEMCKAIMYLSSDKASSIYSCVLPFKCSREKVSEH